MRFFAFALVCVMAQPAFAEKTVSDGVSAVVNDSVITYHDVQQHIQEFANLLISQYGRQPDVLRQKISELRQEGQEQLIERQLILHEYKTGGYNFPESYIEDEIQRIIAQQFRDRATLLQGLHQQGITYETWRQQQRERILVGAMQQFKVPRDIVISPQKIRDYYETNKTNFMVGEQVRLRTLVLNKSASDNGAARQLAQEIRQKIKEGAAFAEMAKIHSEAAQRANAGEAVSFQRDKLRKELADVAFNLQPGQVSDVIDLPDSCWLLWVEEKSAAHVRPIAEVQDEIERTLRLTEAARLQRKWIKRLREKAFVAYF
jgi:peptidyl-prolyl cis-trans isomerase SurA